MRVDLRSPTQRFDVCHYYINVPKDLWKAGNIYVKFDKIGRGLNVHIMGGRSIKEMTTQIIEHNAPAIT